MANKRVFYAAKRVGLGPCGSAGGAGTFQQLHGIQSVGMTTTFNLEQTFELGQLAIYENIEGIPDVSIDIEKVLDGYVPVYVLATSISGGDEIASDASLVGRSKTKCDFALEVHQDTDQIAGGTQTSAGQGGGIDAEAIVQCSGVFVNSVSYNIATEGYATESVTLVGQDKVWYGHSAWTGSAASFSADDLITDEDSPLAETVAGGAVAGSGGVNMREDVMFNYPGKDVSNKCALDVNGAVSGFGTVLPRQIPGISASGTNDYSGGQFGCHLTSFSCSTDLGREDIFELGRKGRYHRFVPFPTEVSCEIGITSVSGDMISATEQGLVNSTDHTNLVNETIRLQMREGLVVDLGKKNKLASVSVTGGDAGGGNEEITYSYTNFNDFSVYHPNDPHWTNADAAINGKFRYKGGTNKERF